MEPTDPQLAPLPKSLSVWFEMLKYNVVRIRKCLDNDSSPQLANVNFRNTIDHLKIGWMMISDREARKLPDPISPSGHSPSCMHNIWDNQKQKDWEKEAKPWWQKDYRFAEFARLAKDDILRACLGQGIPLMRKAKLSSYLRGALLACKISKFPNLRNPIGWDNFKNADELFAKSICMMIKGDHRWLDTLERRNLSHLLAHLQHALGMTDSCSSL
jgi:hypothetical protein